MSASVFHSIATQFRDRYLNPLQFHSGAPSHTAAPARQGLHTQPQTGTDEHFDHVMSRSADLLARTKPAQPSSPSWGAQMGQRLGDKHDRVEAADHAQVMHRSGDILQNIRNTAAEHRDWSPLPEERHADAMARTGATLDRIRQSQAVSDAHAPAPAPVPVQPVKSQQQFDQSHVTQAAKAAPRPARTYAAPSAQQPAAGVSRGVQRPLPHLPAKSTFAVGKPDATRTKKSAAAPAGPGKGQMSFDDLSPKPRTRKSTAAKTPSASEWHSMLTDVVNKRK